MTNHLKQRSQQQPSTIRGASRFGTALTGVLLLTGVAACGDQDSAPQAQAEATVARPKSEIKLSDTAVDMPAQMPGGLVDVQLDASPSTKRSHHLAFFRRNDGVSVKQLEKASDAEFESLVTYEGGNAQVNAGASQAVTFDLDPGNYTVIDFDEQQNMLIAETTVGARTQGAAEPTAKGTIKLGPGMKITLPKDFDGTGVWKVVNDDPSLPHEAGVGRLAPNKTSADAIAWAKDFAGPPPIETVGGFGAISPGHQGWVDLGPKQAPGNYLVYCALPGSDGMLHLAMGMATEFPIN